MIIKRWNSTNTLAFLATTNGTTTLTVSSTRDLVVGAGISGGNIPAGTTIASITNATTLVMSAAATGSGTNATTFTGVFNEQFPKTVAQKVFSNNGAVSIFDTNDKIKLAYLPDAVFDSLYFHDTIGNIMQNDQETNVPLRDIASYAFQFPVNNRAKQGMYYVATTTCTLTANTTGQTAAYGSLFYIASFGGREENLGPGGTSVVLEPGDWVVITSIAGGNGSTIGGAIGVQFSVVNNTYEFMTGATSGAAGTPGIVPTPSAGDQLKFLRGDGTWVVPTDTNTTYTGSTSITLSGTSFQRAALTGDVTAGANSNATTIANDVVTFAKMQNVTTARMLGRTSANDGDIELLTAATVRTFLNVADGATANLGTVTAVTGTGPIVSSGGTTPAISITAATQSAAGSMSSADKTKLDGIATGATANTGTVTSVGGTGSVSGLTLTGTVTSSGNLTLGGELSTSAASITSGTLAVARGGTGQTSYANGELLIGNTTGGTLAKATLTQGTGITITNGAGAITVTNASPNATHTGDVTGATALTIANAAVTNAKMANMVQNTIKGRITASTGAPEDLTAANVRTIIELAAPIYIQTATPTATVANSLWYDIN
jgi:hypothetical protein